MYCTSFAKCPVFFLIFTVQYIVKYENCWNIMARNSRKNLCVLIQYVFNIRWLVVKKISRWNWKNNLFSDAGFVHSWIAKTNPVAMFPFKFIMIIFAQLKYILRLQCSIISCEMYFIHTNFKIIQLFLTCERQPRCLNTVRIIGWQKPTSNHHDKIGLTLFNI